MSFSFIQITDHHLGESEDSLFYGFNPAHALRKILAHIAQNLKTPIDFIVSTGDLVENPTPASYQFFKALLGIKTEAPSAPGPMIISAEGVNDVSLYVLPGNHDDRKFFYKALFDQNPASKLMNVRFEHKGIQFICLDFGPEARGFAYDATLEFLSRSLDSGPPAILLQHHHLNSLGSRWMDALNTENLDQLHKVIEGKNVLGILHGHTHFTFENEFAGIPVLGLRSTSYSFALQDEPLACLTPPHYRRVTIEDGVLTSEVFEVQI